MTLQLTSPDELLAELGQRIAAINPRRAAHRDARWHRRPGEDMRGAALRTFDFLPLPTRVDPRGPHGDGIGYVLPLRIRISYPDLDAEDAMLTVAADGEDLWMVLEQAHLDLPGMLPFDFRGRDPYRWVPVDQEQRNLVIDFVIELPFLGSDRFTTHQDAS